MKSGERDYTIDELKGRKNHFQRLKSMLKRFARKRDRLKGRYLIKKYEE